MNTQPSYEAAKHARMQCLNREARKPIRSPLLTSARQDVTLVGTLAAADEMAMFNLLQQDWQKHLAAFPSFADDFESADPYVCDMSQLAELAAQAPTPVIRQAVREIALCRMQMASILGLATPTTDERTKMVLAGANAEWEISISMYPTFSAWLSTMNRLTCSRAELAEIIHHAPTFIVRHALRETFCFREIASLITPHAFA